MTCTPAIGDIQILFGRANGQVILPRFNASTFSLDDSIANHGITATFQAQIKPGEPMPLTGSICLIRQVISNGFEHIYAGRYEREAVTFKGFVDEFQFTINTFIDYCQRDFIEDYTLDKRTFTGHIEAAMVESRAKDPAKALTLVNLETIAGDDNVPFQMPPFKLGRLDAFLDAICAFKKAKWKIKPVKFLDYEAKTAGSYTVIEILIDGVNQNKAVPGKCDPAGNHCDDPLYLQIVGPAKEVRDDPIASRFLVNGRNGRKDPVII
jgi:hypothetical protein